MANRTFQPPAGSLDRSTCTLHGHVQIGAIGALSNKDCNGFDITRTGVGLYTITLDDIYPQSDANYVAAGTKTPPLLNLLITPLDAGVRLFGMWSIVSQTVHVDGKINIVFDASANTPQDPNNGARLRITVVLKNSSTPRKGM